MEEIAISKFKATCLALIEKVRRTGEPILVTRKGQPVAQVLPPPPPQKPKTWLGCLSTKGKIIGDIISPICNEDEWEVFK